MKEPDLQDFGITDEEHDLYTGKGDDRVRWPAILVLILSVAVSVGFIVIRFWVGGFLVGETLLLGLLIFGVAFIVIWVVIGIPVASIHWAIKRFRRRFKRSHLLASPIAYRIKQYEEAMAAYPAMQAEAERVRQKAEKARWEAEAAQRIRRRRIEEAEEAQRRKHYDHWMSLSGTEFERQLGILYRQRGYRVESTPTSGDEGIDLILRKNGKTTVVQCKSHQKPVGPAIARELLGSMVAFRADDAILACTGGFTRGVKDFVRGKPITLISASELARIGSSVEHVGQDPAEFEVRFGSKE